MIYYFIYNHEAFFTDKSFFGDCGVKFFIDGLSQVCFIFT